MGEAAKHPVPDGVTCVEKSVHQIIDYSGPGSAFWD
jgi:hypothetical protein